MQTEKAILQLAEIHRQLVTIDSVRVFRSASVAMTGLLAMGGAVSQWAVGIDPQVHPALFMTLWIAIAAGGAGMTLLEMMGRAMSESSSLTRELNWMLVRQFTPFVLGGALITWALMDNLALIIVVPGVWGLIFGLGILACAHWLPKRCASSRSWRFSSSLSARGGSASSACSSDLIASTLFSARCALGSCAAVRFFANSLRK